MKGVIIFKGKYGATRQYAEWLASLLQIPAMKTDLVTGETLSKYDFVVIGSSVYVGRLLIKDWIKHNLASIQNKKIFLFIVCGTAPGEKDKLKKITEENIPGEIRNKTDVFFLQGRMIKKNLSWLDRTVLRLGAFLTKNPVDREHMLQDIDEVKKENILPLLKAINTHCSGAGPSCTLIKEVPVP